MVVRVVRLWALALGVDLPLPSPPKFRIGGVQAFVSGDLPEAEGWAQQAWARFVAFYTSGAGCGGCQPGFGFGEGPGSVGRIITSGMGAFSGSCLRSG